LYNDFSVSGTCRTDREKENAHIVLVRKSIKREPEVLGPI